MSLLTLLADQVVSSTALNANIANLDEGVSNFDGVYATHDGTNSQTSLILGLQNIPATFPASLPRKLSTGSNLQTFRARVRKNVDADGNTVTCNIRLYINGVATGTVSTTFTITSATGQDISFTWDASVLSNLDGDDVQIGIIQLTGGTEGGPQNRRRLETDTVDWIADVENFEIFPFSGSGSLSISGTALEKDIDSYIGSGSLSISGNCFESFIRSTYIGSGSLSISGTALEKNIDSYISFGSFSISGITIEKEIDSYIGLGTIHTQPVSALSVNNPFQIPRLYVTIV